MNGPKRLIVATPRDGSAVEDLAASSPANYSLFQAWAIGRTDLWRTGRESRRTDELTQKRQRLNERSHASSHYKRVVGGMETNMGFPLKLVEVVLPFLFKVH